MTPVQTRPQPTGPASPTHPESAVPEVWDDMTVEVALSVLAGARVGHLLVCDADGQCVGRVTRARLSAARSGAAYTDRVRLRDLTGVTAAPVTV